MRLYTPSGDRPRLEPEGRRAHRRKGLAVSSRRALSARSHGVCEGCRGSGLALDREHVYGRAGTGARLGWPWCDLPELGAALCRDCHERKTNPRTDADHDLAERLRERALQRFCRRGFEEGWLRASAVDYHADADGDLVGAIRRAVEDAKANGAEELVLGG